MTQWTSISRDNREMTVDGVTYSALRQRGGLWVILAENGPCITGLTTQQVTAWRPESRIVSQMRFMIEAAKRGPRLRVIENGKSVPISWREFIQIECQAVIDSLEAGK